MATRYIQGGEKLHARLAEIAKNANKASTVSVGFLSSATYPDGTPVAQIAAIQEFGAPAKGIPPRPYFRNMVAAKSDEWPDAIANLLVANNYDAELTLGQSGEAVAGQLRQSIIDTNAPPNSPVTNLLKQRFPKGGQTFNDVLEARRDVEAGTTAPAGKPLVQSGHMLNSIDYEVE